MSLQPSILWIILGGMLVTSIPRILPFMIIRKLNLPEPVLKWLGYVPICILTALIVESTLKVPSHGITSINLTVILAIIPTCMIAIWRKSLLLTVIVGIITMAIIRFLLG
ncbi:AzlD domain-containing protein [Terrilactibacillus laevilacticus]|uniref:AzlD domain-containing protein n=1 Tax=Terrilactibacillus laevilacticus TaxID=1380157 RepID=A0ABW5PQR4_9BACI|nr:AzlD domain-containing protein [Terrilactibacillus laevilacticus]